MLNVVNENEGNSNNDASGFLELVALGSCLNCPWSAATTRLGKMTMRSDSLQVFNKITKSMSIPNTNSVGPVLFPKITFYLPKRTFGL